MHAARKRYENVGSWLRVSYRTLWVHRQFPWFKPKIGLRNFALRHLYALPRIDATESDTAGELRIGAPGCGSFLKTDGRLYDTLKPQFGGTNVCHGGARCRSMPPCS